MKEYKFVWDSFPDELTKKVNRLIKKGFVIENWKINDKAIVVLLSRESKDE